MMVNKFLATCALAVLAAAGAVPLNAHAQCNIYMSTNQQAIDGFGFSSAWSGQLPAAKNNALYGTLGMSILRIRIDDGKNWNDEITNAANAHAAGAKVFGTAWYGPGAWRDTNDFLLPAHYLDFANWLNQAAIAHNLDWVSPANEPDLGWQAWTSSGLTTWTALYAPNIGRPLIEAESCWFSDSFMDPIIDDTNAGPNISVFAGHLYGVSPAVHQDAINQGKHVWMTEHYIDGEDDINACMAIAKEISDCLNDQMSAYIWWWVTDSDTNVNLVMSDGTIHKNGYTIGQFAKWIRPGSTRVSADYNPSSGVFVTACNNNGNVVIVAVNTNTGSVNQQFVIRNGNSLPLEGYRTSGSQGMADIGGFTLSSGGFSASLPAQSVTTFVQTNATPANLPSPWLAQDVGSVGIVGSATYANTVATNGVFTVAASGNDIWSAADAFRFVSEANAGNCTILARVNSEQSTNANAKAGVMIRNSLNPNAANAFIAVTASNGVVFQYRSSDGGGSGSNRVSGFGAPCWVKLVQSGATFTGYYSADGTSWTPLGTTTISMGSTTYAGLAFCNNGNASLGMAAFDNVSAPGWPIPTPAAPAGLTATGGVEQATLTWQPGSYAANYIVQRATASGGPYTTIATVIRTRYVDSGLAGGTTYYYQVTAVNGAGRATNATPASVTPVANVPSPWVAQDVGAMGMPGGESFTNGVFSVTASGDDIWNAADAFRFVYVPVTNNFTLMARVASVDSVDPWSKAGLMIRQTLNSNSINALIAVTPGNGVTWQYRSSTGGGTANAATSGLGAPCWVKLVRSGNTFTGYYSADGTNWTQQGTATFTMTSTAYVGLAVTAHNNSDLCAAAFDHVSGAGWSPAATATPAGLIATAGVEQVALTWQASANATTYYVYRSTTNGGPYQLVASVATTNFTDIPLASRATNYYVVTAVNYLAGESAGSAQVSAAAIINVPLPWLTRDIGSVGLMGAASFTNGVFTVTASGDDIWNSADAFRFVYLTNSGDFTIVARVVSLQNIDGWSKAGIMARDSLDPGAANAFIAVTPGNGVTWQYRSSDGGGCNNNNTAGLGAPYWVKLVRGGNTFTGYRSASGTSWTQMGSTSLTNISYIGLAVTAHNRSSLCTATFDNVNVPGWSATALTVNAVAASTSQINLTWNALTNATNYSVKRSATNGGPYSVIASGLTATNYTDSGLSGGTVYYYVLSAIVSGSETANSMQVSATTQAGSYGSLIHRYSFGETGGTNVADSVAGPVWAGTLPNGGALSGGQLAFSGASQNYVSLPAGIVSSLSNFTVMAWVNLNSASNWCRIFDFGNNNTTNLLLTPACGGSGTLRFAVTTNSSWNEQQINCSLTLSTGAWHQVAVTLSGTTGVLYLDGTAVGTNSSLTINPLSLGSTANNYIGKSQYADPYLDGAMDEFRIYNVGLSPAEVAAAYALGSGQLLSTNSPAMGLALTGTNLTFSWPVASAGCTLQARTNLTLGGWMNVTSPAPQITNGQWQVVLPQPGNTNSVFYRLAK